jgi:beta-N-acetylhexosaminidase
MTDARTLAARMLCVGFDGPTLPESARDLFSAGVGFAVLFARNVVTPEQVAALNDSIKQAASGPVMICVDQEGGRVRRLREGFSPIPSMRQLGQAAARSRRPADLARSLGRVLGSEIRAVGFDVVFGPVLDVDTNPDNPVIADRSLSRDPAEVALLGCALIEGIQGVGVAACGKHFPGHGDTSQDSHYHLPRLDHDLRRLAEVELVPFTAAANGLAAMMSSHIVFAPLDAHHPATLSPTVLGGLLRDQLGFDGVVFTDDMEMKAIANFYDFDDAVLRAINAGCDVITVCHTLEKQRRAIDVIAAAIESGRLSRERIDQSIRRIDRLATRFARPVSFDSHLLNHDTHRGLMEQIAGGHTNGKSHGLGNGQNNGQTNGQANGHAGNGVAAATHDPTDFRVGTP